MRLCVVARRGGGGPTQKGKRLDDGEGMLRPERWAQHVLLVSTGLYMSRTRLPLLTSDARPGRYPFLGMASLAAVNVAVFGCIDTVWEATDLAPHLVASLERPWTLVTANFSHAQFPHLLGNVVAMGLFGWRLWRALGGAAVWGLYVTGGAAAQLVVALSASGVGLGASGSVLALAGASAVLLRKDAASVGVLGAVPLPLAALLFATTEAVSITRGLLPPHAAHCTGALCGLAYVALRREYLFRSCSLVVNGQRSESTVSGQLADRHVPLRCLFSEAEKNNALTALDLSYARSRDGAWHLLKFRGFFDELLAARFARLEELNLSGCAFRAELRLERLPPSIRVLKIEHAAARLGGSCAGLRQLRCLLFSGSHASLGRSFRWEAAMRQLTELAIVLPPVQQQQSVISVSPLHLRASGQMTHLSLDGVSAVLVLPRHNSLSSLHLGRGVALEWAEEEAGKKTSGEEKSGWERLERLGASSPQQLPAVPAPRVAELYLDMQEWEGHPFPNLFLLFPNLAHLTLHNAECGMRVAVPDAVLSLRLIDCDAAVISKRSDMETMVETALPQHFFRRLPAWLRR